MGALDVYKRLSTRPLLSFPQTTSFSSLCLTLTTGSSALVSWTSPRPFFWLVLGRALGLTLLSRHLAPLANYLGYNDLALAGSCRHHHFRSWFRSSDSRHRGQGWTGNLCDLETRVMQIPEWAWGGLTKGRTADGSVDGGAAQLTQVTSLLEEAGGRRKAPLPPFLDSNKHKLVAFHDWKVTSDISLSCRQPPPPPCPTPAVPFSLCEV
ncbi:hypothetical protein BJ165DRAFT_1109201 [Panaeolus papilionaceus]|nr:hypothetical protein BJ165DRAFT_1109201 [Panaeolus papilionaceus]